MAFNILKAMEEPIKKGDKALYWDGPQVLEVTFDSDIRNSFYPHQNYLRLPSRFQAEEKKECANCGSKQSDCMNMFHDYMNPGAPGPEKFECPLHGLDRDERLCTCKPSDAVENKIAFICGYWSLHDKNLDIELRELVDLVRREK